MPLTAAVAAQVQPEGMELHLLRKQLAAMEAQAQHLQFLEVALLTQAVAAVHQTDQLGKELAARVAVVMPFITELEILERLIPAAVAAAVTVTMAVLAVLALSF